MTLWAVLLVAVQLAGASAVHADNVQQNRRVVRRLYDEVFSKWNLAVIDELVSPEFLGHEMPPGFPRGPKGFRQFYGGIRAAFPDVQLTVEDMIGEGERVVVRWRGRATHQGMFRGIPPTSAEVSFTGIAIYRLSNGKIVERWVEVDMLGLTDQLRAKAAPKDSQQEIKHTMERYMVAARAVDPDAIATFFAPTAVLLEPGIAPVHTRDSIRAFMASFPGVRVEVATATPDTIEVFGDTALFWGSYFERLAFPGQPVSEQHGKFVIEWVHQPDGTWLIQRFFRIPVPSPR